MTNGVAPDGLRLTEEEAYALLSLCLTSPNRLDATSEKAVRKLSAYCSTERNCVDSHHSTGPQRMHLSCELSKAGI
jgi:hypothetical protein